MSDEVRSFLQVENVIQTRTTPYHPTGNGQVERLNGTLWQTICLALESRNFQRSLWEMVLPEALNAIRSLL